MQKIVKTFGPLALLAGFGVWLVWGKHSLSDTVTERLGPWPGRVFGAVLIVFFVCVLVWAVQALRHWVRSKGSGAAKLVVACAIGCLATAKAEAWFPLVVQGPPLPQAAQPAGALKVEVQQPFALPPDQQAQVDAAVASVAKDAQAGVLSTVEFAFGIAIAAVIIGTVIVIIVRLVAKWAGNLARQWTNRMAKAEGKKDETQGAVRTVGAALLLHAVPKTTNYALSDHPFTLELTASAGGQPPIIERGWFPADGEDEPLAQWCGEAGVPDLLPADSFNLASGTIIAREPDGYNVTADGFPGAVRLGFETATNAAQAAWERVLNITVPAGARVLFADETHSPAAGFWRVVARP